MSDPRTLCYAQCHSPMHDLMGYDHGGDITECMVQHSDWVELVLVEPDYEAATDRLSADLDYNAHTATPLTDDEMAIRAVDAALRIKETYDE